MVSNQGKRERAGRKLAAQAQNSDVVDKDEEESSDKCKCNESARETESHMIGREAYSSQWKKAEPWVTHFVWLNWRQIFSVARVILHEKYRAGLYNKFKFLSVKVGRSIGAEDCHLAGIVG
jgi:hypothetical protein